MKNKFTYIRLILVSLIAGYLCSEITINLIEVDTYSWFKEPGSKDLIINEVSKIYLILFLFSFSWLFGHVYYVLTSIDKVTDFWLMIDDTYLFFQPKVLCGVCFCSASFLSCIKLFN